ncbi:hypothetical protein PIB30_032778 [Stylosanthes scabra]|uniref:Uncharacterized protein n=1 Tax=Stylosanthes scabra TaxID=79078 RepID=A0ABU6VB52_9FABA|nr:hypothetical protein [Stylosanthes scabra]
MEEEKAAAYYDELTRKGEGAARFKQGLGFSTAPSNDDVPNRASAIPSSSSFLSKFVKASASSTSNPPPPSDSDKQAALLSVQDKLKKKPAPGSSRVPEKNRDRDSDRTTRRRSRSRSRSRDRYRERGKESRRRSRSRERHSHRDRDRDRRRSRRRSRSRSRGRRRSRSTSVSPRRSEKNRDRDSRRKGNNAGVDYAKLIPGYETMSSADRVKAKMKLQLSQTAAQDSEKGEGWERFEFDKDAPLDDEEIEAAEDDASLVKKIGQGFRYSKIEVYFSSFMHE